MAAGNPVPNYYASSPLEAAVLDGNKGIYVGDNVSPAKKLLTRWGLATPTAGLVGEYALLDYLLYYPFVDGDSTDQQDMIQTASLPRYTDGDGVRAIMVAVAPTTGGGSFTYNYTDQTGVDKTSPAIACSVAVANIASLVTSEPATAAGGLPFLPMADGSTGIKKINWVTFSVPNGGLAAFVLVKRIDQHAIYEASVTSEKQYPEFGVAPPEIKDGAYINQIMRCAATVAAGTLAGDLKVVFS